MKKVVLLAGAIAAGMAIAPQTANAAAPTTPGVDEVNAIAMDQAAGEVAIAKAEVLQGRLHAILTNLEFESELTAAQKAEIQKAYSDVTNLLADAKAIFDDDIFTRTGNLIDGYRFVETGSNQGKFNSNPKSSSYSWIKDYSAELSTGNTIADLLEKQIAAHLATINAAETKLGTSTTPVDPSTYQAKNEATENKVKATDEYDHLQKVLDEAKGILDGTDPLYSDKIYEDLMDDEFDAHLKDGAMVSATNLLNKIDGASEVTTELVSEYELMVDLAIVTPELEGLVSTFKKHANEEAAKHLQDVIADRNIDGENGIIENLQHHLDEKCFDKTGHVISEDIAVKDAKKDLEDTMKSLNPDEAWNALTHDADPANVATDRSLNDPIAVVEWAKHQNPSETSVIDEKLDNYETAVYTVCLTYDFEDIEAAIAELDGDDYRKALEDGETAKDKVAVASDVKAWLHDYLTDDATDGTLAKEYKEFNDDVTNNVFMGDITASQFATLEDKVDVFENTLANIKANWEDIESLNDDVLDLKVDMANAKENAGYDSAYIKDQWENATTGELKHYNDLLGDVETAIDNIDEKATSWVGADSFADEIALENDHHDWLDQYQKENYDAKQDMLAAIEVRKKELDTVTTFAITSDDPENPMTLADGTELYTTDTNKDAALWNIKGEDNTSKYIYQDKFFNELREHFYNGADGTLETTPVYVTDGNPIDLKDDQILAWYNDGDAQYIVKKTYDATWKAENAKREGELINNTVEGLQITTSKLSATGILVMNPEVTTEGNEVVFGWLQKEIQNAFARAVENEKANKDIHDKYQEVVDYIADGQALINDGAKIAFGAEDVPALDIEVYDMVTRYSSEEHRDAINWNVYMTHVGNFKGNILGFPTPIQWNLNGELDSEKYLEEGWTTATPLDLVSYNPVFDCHHETDVWGWTKIQKVMDDLLDLEKKEYDKVASLALLNGTTKMDLDGDSEEETFEETLAEVKENVDDITNEAYTQLYINGLAYVQQTLNTAKGWAMALDGICHTEDALKPCSDEDMKNNPCGWDEAEAKAKLQAIINEWNAEFKLVTDTDHKGTEDAPEVNDTAEKLADFKAYVIKALNDIRAWEVAFAKADKEHKVKLNDAYDLEKTESHTLHHYALDAKAAMKDFSADGADANAADVWAADFNARVIGTFDGEEVTFQQFLAKLVDTIAHSPKHPEPDVYAGVEAVIANGITCFADYVAATENIEDICNAYGKHLFDHHLYTELKKFAEGLKNFNWNADFNKKLEANKDAHVEYISNLDDLATEIAAVEIAAAEVYGEEYTGDKEKTTKEQLEALVEALNTKVDTVRGEVNTAYEAGTCDLYEFSVTDIVTGINELKAALEAAKNFHAANVAAADELNDQVDEIEAAVLATNIEADLIYAQDADDLQDLYDAALAAVVAERNNITTQFNAGTAVDYTLSIAPANALKNLQAAYAAAKAELAANKELKAEFNDALAAITAELVEVQLNEDKLYADDYTALDARYDALQDQFSEAVATLNTLFAQKNTANFGPTLAALQNAVNTFKADKVAAENLYAANVAAKAELEKTLGDIEANVAGIVVNEDALYADDYTALDAELEALKGTIDTVRGEIATAFDNKKATEYNIPATLAPSVIELQEKIKAAENVYAANVLARTELNAQLDAFQATVAGVVINEEKYYADDYTALDDKLEALKGAIDTVRGEIATAFDDKKATEYNIPTSLATALYELQQLMVEKENLLANNKAAFAKFSTILDNYETELRAIARDAESVYGETASEKDLAHLDAERDKIQGMIDAARTALQTAFDTKVAPEYETEQGDKLIAINSELELFRQMVADYEEFKRQNFAEATKLYNDFTNLLVVTEALKDYGTVYEDEVEGGYDKTHIDRQIETLESTINGQLSWLKADLEAGDVVANLADYADVYAYALDEIENIKEAIEYAEQLWAANYRALNNLEEHIKAVETVLHTTKAMCACNECNEEDMEAVQGHLDTLADILDAVNESFSDTKDLAMKEGAFNGQIEDVEADVANLLALIQLHLDTAQNDLRVYNTLQALLASTVDAEMLKLEAEEGYKHFADRDAYHADDFNPERPHFHDGATTNPNVKYGNELTQLINDLKAEIDRQHSHEGGHTCEENKLADVKAMNEIVAEIQKTIAAVKANEAAHQLLQDRFAELFADAKDAYEFWHQYYSEKTLIAHGAIADYKWVTEWNGELENGQYLAGLENLLHDYYVHGNAANAWTVDGKGEELNGAANDKFAEYDEELANDRNELAHTEAVNHAAQVTDVVMTYVNNTKADYTAVDAEGWTLTDPFVKEIMVDWTNDVEGEFGLIASLNYYKEQIELAYEDKVMEDAINIDEHNSALGIHQQLDGILGVLTQIIAEYDVLFENAHHLTNGKTVYSDMEYYTIGFFRKANEGLGEQAQEMFKTVEVDYDPYVGNIGIYDMNWLETEAVDPGRGGIADEEATELPEFTQDILVPVRDEQDHLVHQEGLGVVPAKVGVLTVGSKSNELTFTLHEEGMREVTTLAPGAADITFQPGSLTVYTENNDAWTTKHPVFIEVVVEAPQVENDVEVDATTGSNKLSVRFDAPLDLTYTINSLVAKTDKGEEITFADRQINYAKGTVDFELPEGTEFVELPAGFFTFRTGENTIARSAAATIYVGNLTSIDTLIAMGEKAEIFDLQGRRVKAESLLSGNAYIVNGEKVMVK